MKGINLARAAFISIPSPPRVRYVLFSISISGTIQPSRSTSNRSMGHLRSIEGFNEGKI